MNPRHWHSRDLASARRHYGMTSISCIVVLAFWREAGPKRWFRKDAAFDAEFRERFLAAHEAATRGELDGWAVTAEGALALLVLLDQFPRNAFRDTPRMFATDARSLAIAKDSIAAGFDMATDRDLRNFFYLPLMHSENLANQQRAVALTEPLGSDAHRFAVLHRDLIQRFGRFPHRNRILGRDTSPEEQQYLDEGGFAG
jgi:uncharacterized protein (DUF924 family)